MADTILFFCLHADYPLCVIFTSKFFSISYILTRQRGLINMETKCIVSSVRVVGNVSVRVVGNVTVCGVNNVELRKKKTWKQNNNLLAAILELGVVRAIQNLRIKVDRLM